MEMAACRHACTLTVQARLHAYRTGRLYQSLMAAMLGAIGSPSAACPRLPLKNETGTNPYY